MSPRDASPDSAQGALVLIVEDEAPIAEALADIVRDAGYTALVAGHGREGLALARLHHPALVITDLMMPYLDGVGLIAALRRLADEDGQPRVPVILMTAAGRGRARDVPADAVLNKPFDLTELEQLLHRFLAPHSS